MTTIFVNPLQFNEGKDFKHYPRTLSSDLEDCKNRGVDIVFSPESDAMYPEGFQSRVLVDRLTESFEGQYRPGHFAGVTTVMTKILNLTGPCSVMIGRKDYQQWKTLERMVWDLQMPVEVIACPTIRSSDGLAMSSRNCHLTQTNHIHALGIVTGLRAAHDAWNYGERDITRLRALTAKPIEENFDHVDYVDVVDPDTLTTAPTHACRLLILAAAHLKGIRLIDNTVLGEDPCP